MVSSMEHNVSSEEVFVLTTDDLLEMYRLMLLSRRFTERILEWYREGLIAQGLHPSIGQEAVGVGACYGLRSGDWVLPSLRTSEVFWTRGVTVLQQLNAMMGNSGSVSAGKESSHHAGYPTRGILAGTGIVGGSIPVAVGAGLALRMHGTDNVMLCFFGDGAANRGDFHEGLNLAAALKVPVVFICENNLYAQMVPASVAMAIEDIADRAAGYGMPGHVVDGQDVMAVYEATAVAVSRAREGSGPSLIECKTYRYMGHQGGKDAFKTTYRTNEEVEEWKRRDPIANFETSLVRMEALTREDAARIDKQVKDQIEEAVSFAQQSPLPNPEEALEDLFA